MKTELNARTIKDIEHLEQLRNVLSALLKDILDIKFTYHFFFKQILFETLLYDPGFESR